MPVMFSIFPIFFIIVFIIVVGGIIFTIVKGVSQWSYNNRQPVLTVQARVTGKRSNTTHHDQMMNDNMMHSSSTTYYATFEVESGDRMELTVPAREYGLLAEEDTGRLTFQGTRYQGFEREI